jgi:hypothetical protein
MFDAPIPVRVPGFRWSLLEVRFGFQVSAMRVCTDELDVERSFCRFVYEI